MTVNPDMDRDEVAALVALHAGCLIRAQTHERAMNRLALSEPSRSEMCGDQAAQARLEARALAKALAPHGVVCPDARTFALMADGGRAPW